MGKKRTSMMSGKAVRSTKRDRSASNEFLGSMTGKFKIVGDVVSSTPPEDWEDDDLRTQQRVAFISQADAERLVAQRSVKLKGKRK